MLGIDNLSSFFPALEIGVAISRIFNLKIKTSLFFYILKRRGNSDPHFQCGEKAIKVAFSHVILLNSIVNDG